MRIICAPDKFKGSLDAADAARLMRMGIMDAAPDAVVDLCPMADGGEGFAGTLAAAIGSALTWRSPQDVTGPMGDRVAASFYCVDQAHGDQSLAIVEMASASGLALAPAESRDPTRATTTGTGELIRAAIDAGRTRILIGIGGSATNDGGCGAAQAMGARFFDRAGKRIDQPITGGMLHSISRIDLAPLRAVLQGVAITAACDVTNPLTGPRGAAHVYAPQKGATPQQVAMLDDGLKHLARITREQLGLDHEHTPGAGAAGGMGFGLLAFFNATLRPGIELVLEAVRFDERVKACDLCLTGEGRFDDQSLAGKVCAGVARAAKKHGVPTIALVGAAGPEIDQAVEQGLLVGYEFIGRGLSQQESMARAGELLRASAKKVCVARWSR